MIDLETDPREKVLDIVDANYGGSSRLLFTILASLAMFLVFFVVLKYLRPPANSATVILRSADRLSDNPTEIKGLLDRRLKRLRQDSDSLAANLKWQAVLVAIALLVTSHRVGNLQITAFTLTVPVRVFRLVLPAILLYLWLQFGFLLHTLIDARLVLYALAERYEMLHPQDLGHTSPFSMHRMFRDNSLQDLWLLASHCEFRVLFEEKSWWGLLNRSLLACIGLFSAVLHASALALIIVDAQQTHAEGRWRQLCYYVYGLAVLLFFCISHVQFLFGGDHDNWFQLVILGASLPLIWLFAKRVPLLLASSTSDGPHAKVRKEVKPKLLEPSPPDAPEPEDTE